MATRKANRVRQIAAQTADRLIQEWEQGWSLVWDHPNPAEVLAELGTDAAEIFDLSAANVQFLATILAGKRQDDLDRILATVAAKPETITNEDGTVTLA